MRFAPCAVLALAGCAQLFGIENTTGAKGGASLQVQRVSIGASVVPGPQDLSAQTSTFYVPETADPTILDATPGVLSANDTWTADVKGNPYVQFTLPDLAMPFPRLWELPASQLTASFVAYEHPNPEPASATEMMQVMATLPAPGWQPTDTYELEAIGAWMSHTLAGAELPATAGATAITATIPYTAFATMIAGNPPYRTTASDSLLLLRYNGAQLTGVMSTSLDQTDATDPVTGTLADVMLDDTFMGTLDTTTVGQRLSTARPGVTAASLAASFSIVAAPGWQQADSTGVRLQSGGIPVAGGAYSAMYGNPFGSLSWHALATISASETRSYTLGGAPLTLSASFSAMGEAATLTPDFAPPLPQEVDIDDNQLVIDGATVTLDLTTTHQIKLLTENKPADAYLIALYDLTSDGMKVTQTLVLQAMSTQKSFTIPVGILQAQHTYVVAASSVVGGFPNLAAGDLQTRSLPSTGASFFGGVFTVNP